MAARRSRDLSGLKRRLAENLVLARNRAGLSQEKAAKLAGLHKTEISLLERELRLPRLDTLVKLAGAFGIEPCELLEGMEWLPPSRQAGKYVQQGVGAAARGSESR
jgi:transcriptional regulator with XRE-family HTH domain